MNKKAFINGKIYTVNPDFPWAEAVLVEFNKIALVGSNEEITKLIDNETEVIDLEGKLMLPGFIDSHLHLMEGGFFLRRLDLGKVKSKEQFRNTVKEFASVTKSEWIRGGNWDHQAFDEKVLPNRRWIDDISNGKPAYLTRLDIHMALANSAALELAGITSETPDPVGGKIMKDENREPTGILKDAAMELVKQKIPEPSKEEREEALKAALDEAKRQGITSVHDISEIDDLELYQEFLRNNKLTCRINSITRIENYKSLTKLKIQRAFGNKYLRIGSVKSFADGSLGSNTAWFWEPYEDEPDSTGLPTDYISNGNLKKWMLECDKHKLQLVTHAIGDRANSEVIDYYQESVDQNPNWDRRLRIEHAQHLKDNDIKRMKRLNIIASMQPAQLYDDGVWTISKIGEGRLKNTHAVKTLIDNGIKVCLGSDWTVTPFNVLHGIWTAVTRQTKDGKNPTGWIPEERVSVEEAVKGYTLNAAYASFEENIKGTIEEGKLADFVVLDKNIFEIKPDEINDTEVDMTVMGGRILFARFSS